MRWFDRVDAGCTQIRGRKLTKTKARLVGPKSVNEPEIRGRAFSFYLFILFFSSRCENTRLAGNSNASAKARMDE